MKEIEYKGEWHTLFQWSAILGVNYKTLAARLERCSSVDEAFNFVDERRQRLIEYNGRVMNLSQWAKELNIPYYCLRSRLNSCRWTVKRAFETPYKPKEE